MTTPLDLSGVAPIATGIYDLIRGHGDQGAYNGFAQVADPFSSQRPQYQAMLQAFMADPANRAANNGNAAGVQSALGRMTSLLDDPSSLEKQPGYQWGLSQAMEGVNRGAGASGLLNSGNRLTALQDRGQGYAQGWQQQIWNELLGNTNANINAGQLGLATQGQGFNQLGQLAGVNAGSPTAAAALMAQGRTATDNATGAGVGGITTGLASILPQLQRLLSGGTNGWGGAAPGGANGSWDIDPGAISGGGANGGWDVSGFDTGGFDPGADWNALFSGLGGP